MPRHTAVDAGSNDEIKPRPKYINAETLSYFGDIRKPPSILMNIPDFDLQGLNYRLWMMADNENHTVFVSFLVCSYLLYFIRSATLACLYSLRHKVGLLPLYINKY